ncbi:hypothetical protein KCP73_25795 [Salmonella enterica subsp. enterica]|nr:hypothetical protein KCP73_25795 [Salmonella enterica subsp. enterica]
MGGLFGCIGVSNVLTTLWVFASSLTCLPDDASRKLLVTCRIIPGRPKRRSAAILAEYCHYGYRQRDFQSPSVGDKRAMTCGIETQVNKSVLCHHPATSYDTVLWRYRW